MISLGKKGQIMDPIHAATYGMLAASRRFEQSAQRVAGAQDLQGAQADFVVETAEQIGAAHQFGASLLAWRTAEEMQGELFDALR